MFYLAVLVAFSEPVAAQFVNGDGEAENQELIVTGSRMEREQVIAPVVTIDSDVVQSSGTTNIADVLAEYPALIGSETSADNSGEDAVAGFTGLNLLNLRNLGTERTLVLVNGRRHVAALPGSQAVDVNTIPAALLERVDILTGGASAVYGSDGVTGVVNFILDRDFEGLTIRGQAGVSEFADAAQRRGSVIAGKNLAGGRGNVAFAYEVAEEDRLSAQQRKRLRGSQRIDFYRNPADTEGADQNQNGFPDFIPLENIRFFDTARGGALDLDFNFAPDLLGDGRRFDPGRFVPDFYQQGGSGTLVSDYGNDLSPQIRRHVASGFAHFAISPAAELFGELKYAKVDAFSLNQPTFDYYLFIGGDNPFIPAAARQQIIPGAGNDMFGQDGLLLTRDNFDLGQRGEEITRQTYRGVLGLRGALAPRTGYEVSLIYGRTDVDARYVNDIFDDRFYAAVDVVRDPATGQPTCRANLEVGWQPDQALASLVKVREVRGPTTFRQGECVPLNLFGEGSPSPQARQFIRADTRDRSAIEQQVASAVLRGDLSSFVSLKGGSPSYAIGAEYRRETSRFRPDEQAAQGFTFTSALAIDEGEFEVKEVFGELMLPVLREQFLADRVNVGGAVRASDYSTIGSAITWNINGLYAPLPDIGFNGTYAKAVRAPNIGELFGGRSQTFQFITDPCLAAEVQNGSSYRAQNCAALLLAHGIKDPSNFYDPRVTNLPGSEGGNPDLLEEKATTWTAGMVVTPRVVPGLRLRADWYNIKIRNAVSTVTAQELANLCVDQPSLANPFCTQIERSAGGLNAGLITSFTVEPQNVAGFSTAGLDINLQYQRPTRLGNFALSLVGNYLNKLDFIGTPGAPQTNRRGELRAPKYQAVADLTWRKSNLTLNYGMSWFSKTSRFSNQEMAGNPDITDPQYLFHKERWVHDLYGEVRLSSGLEVFAGLNNVFGQRPELGEDTYPVSSVGRFLFAGARLDLGPS